VSLISRVGGLWGRRCGIYKILGSLPQTVLVKIEARAWDRKGDGEVQIK
jgi:hypothetical protein